MLTRTVHHARPTAMSDRVFFPLALLGVAALVALALVWP
ncbi:hypothetical protein QE389_001354 [Brevundimonas sp. SORGH_AS 993]|nr:hypothetical protein [Brevundimonas sp. SORGH_AS_0993]